jgi:hypothetical protein
VDLDLACFAVVAWAIKSAPGGRSLDRPESSHLELTGREVSVSVRSSLLMAGK